MSRARNIKPGFFRNEDLAECDPMARLLFVGLWMLADRNGNLEDRPKRIKGEIFPYDNCEVEILLAQLIARGLAFRYEVDGKPYIAIPRFLQHQNPHHSERPQHPKPNQNATRGLPENSGSNRAESLLLNPESLLPLTESVAVAPFADFWKQYPKKVARQAAEKAWKKCADSSAAIFDDLRRRNWPDKQFIPNPATYLNQRRWEDEDVPRSPSAKEQANLDKLAGLIGGVKRVPK